MAELTGKEVWKYRSSRKIKHFFFKTKHATAICGESVLWYAPDTEQWKDDKDGLDQKSPCGRCLRCINSKG